MAVLVLAGAAAAVFPTRDPDVWFHLAIGRQIVDTGRIGSSEVLCALSDGRPFVNHEWLFDVAVWGAQALGGALGLAVFRAVLSGLLLGLSGMLALRLGASPWVAGVVGCAFLPLFRESLEARPHLAGWGFAAWLTLLLTGPTPSYRRRAVAVFLLVAAWANVHGSFPLAWVLLGWWVVSADAGIPGERGRRALVALGGLAAPLVTPWGPKVLAVVLHHAGAWHAELIPEWAAITWGQSPPRDLLFLAMFAGVLGSFLPRVNRGGWREFALALVFLLPAGLAMKFVALPVAGALPVAAANLSRWLAQRPVGRRVGAASVVLVVAAIGVFAWALPPGPRVGIGADESEFPAGALAFLADRGTSGTVFAPYHQGGFVEYAAFPQMRPLIDGRDYVHGIEGVREYLGALADYPAFKRLDQRFRFAAVVADVTDSSFPRLVEGLDADPAFALVWLDDRFAAWVPSPTAPAGKAYSLLKATTDPRFLFALPDAQVAAAAEEVERVLARPEGETRGLLLRGVLSLRRAGLGWALDDALGAPRERTACREAIADLDHLVARRPDVIMFRYFQAVALACDGRCPEAAAAAEGAGVDPGARALSARIRDGGCRERPADAE